jgi:hypothetical protein
MYMFYIQPDCHFPFLGILAVFLLQGYGLRDMTFFLVSKDDSAIVRFLVSDAIYLALALIAVLSAYIGYRLIVAAGATSAPVIPAPDYELLAPLVADGKADSIDQYVRLSSLARFTGTFTQLGLTGLPLATIFLTLFFSVLTLFESTSFLDLTKLTLGAFIGSFVQRQVERRAEGTGQRENVEESVTPRASA